MKQRDIEKILTEFNFGSTLKMMRAVNWKHNDKPVTRAGLKRLARRLFANLADRHDSETSSSGGLQASRWIDGEGCEHIALEFIGEEWDIETGSNEREE